MNTLNVNRNHKLKSNYEQFEILFSDYRKSQYDFIDALIRNSIMYLSAQNNNYLKLIDVHIKEIQTYNSIHHNLFTQYEVITTTKDSEPKLFVKLLFPTLINNNYFMLNDNYYVPSVYILDKPIVIKFGSIKLTSLFNSITIYAKKNVCIFCKENIPLGYFLQLFIDHNTYNNIVAKFKILHNIYSDDEIILYFSNLFGQNFKNKDEIIKYIERLFFDNYTRKLYETSYSFQENNLTNIVNYSVELLLNNTAPSFIDLKNKRVVFIEMLMQPYFKKIGAAAQSASKKWKMDQLKFDPYEIIKTFKRTKDQSRNIDGLDGNYLYDISNLYGGTLIHKCSFVNPGSKNPPAEIANIHPTFFGKICPITVADMTPGHTVSVVPETYLDIFGNFLNV